MERPSRFWRVMRIVYAALLGIFTIGVLAQAYLAGRGLFGVDGFAAHASFGWPLAHGFAVLVLVASFLTRGPKRLWIVSIVWGLAVMALPVLAVLDEGGAHPAEAFHPLLAMVVLGLSLYLLATTWSLVRATRQASPAGATAPPDLAPEGIAAAPAPVPARGLETPALPLPPRARSP